MPSSIEAQSMPVSGGVFDDFSFDSYCVVCDRLILPPKEPENEAVKMAKKKSAGGTIRVKNPDGTTTTRSANGTKTTRPGLKRNPNSVNRLAAVVAANNNAASKFQPLTRSKTTDVASDVVSPKHEPPSPLATPVKAEPLPQQFHSSIYCSPACEQMDAGRSQETYESITRSFSYDLTDDQLMHINTTSVSPNPYAPPSPLFVSGSDTESSNASNNDPGPAYSAPKMMEYFRMSRDGHDLAWREVERQRRASIQPNAERPGSMLRQRSMHGPLAGEQSSDSLSSLWVEDLMLARSISGGGMFRGMTPVHDREVHGTDRRSASSSSERSVPISFARPPVRSNLSQTSLAASPHAQPVSIPPQFGSAPKHTLSLLQSYAESFPVRDASSHSTSYQKGFVWPTASTTLSGTESRRGSETRPLCRPSSGTIRARKVEGPATWDEFGKGEVMAQRRKNRTLSQTNFSATAPVDVIDSPRGRHEVSPGHDMTPKQSLEVENGRWKIRYHADRSSSRSSTASSSNGVDANGLAIPRRADLGSSAGTARSRTPQAASTMLPPSPHLGVDGMMANLNLRAASAPKTGFNWDKHQERGGKVYELPAGLKVDRSKSGLFYFN
ncbi:hypothetical protein BCR39DRAFT_117035 [Naematelia encephala]|uniref:Uncharacterized protein n=1 Tax=Naematelia encephala TaxID=71784 RepID=A0A1Y2BKH2_9TREE|nr:hypothetical protein BCR39DRAFT_117035 [Naematelia encephala]